MNLNAVWLTLCLAGLSTLTLLVVGLPLAYWLAHSKWRGKLVVESIITLPLVLPPTVLGFYLLLAFSPENALGSFVEQVFGIRFAFSFLGILLASVIFNLPFAVRPFTAAFSQMDTRLIEASWCLGESRWRTFWRITIPICWPGILTGIVLSFAHTMGEFGVVLMVGGNIPGVTRTLSIAIYDDVQAFDYNSATKTSLLLIGFSLLGLVAFQYLSRKGFKR